MIVKINLHRHASILEFNKETGELLVHCNNQGSNNQYPISIFVAKGHSKDDNQNVASCVLKVGKNGGMNLVDKEKH